jgi:spermidine/putrescine transport system ATP-binding protein/putrescine transport system ATP-binding protein
MSAATYLHIDGVTKRFGDVLAVDNAQLAIARGEFFSLLGPSGCGKTTLLRMIAGFEFPSSGDIHFEGVRMTDAPPHKRPSNMVFQSYAIFPHLNVFDNIAYGLRRDRLARAELTGRVEAALAMIKLDGFGPRKADELSGGQRQRVALARALVRRPKVLLLDEPLGALDRRLREAMQLELRALQKSVGITFVFVTHDQEEALSMSDRIAVMSAGRMLQVAAPRTLYESPNCREVADFIGQMNFFAATVRRRDAEMAEIDGGAMGALRLATREPVGTELLLALRPENIAVSRHPVANAVQGVVSAVAYLGERSHYAIAVPGLQQPLAVTAQNTPRAGAPAPGDAVHLSWPADAVVILPRD